MMLDIVPQQCHLVNKIQHCNADSGCFSRALVFGSPARIRIGAAATLRPILQAMD